MDWLPFFLHPEYPEEGMPRADLERRYGPAVHGRTRQVIEAAGLTFSPPARMPNTLHALQVTELARDAGLHEPVHTRLMHAYWSEGADLADDAVLLDLVAEAGLDREEAEAVLADGRYAERIAASTEEAHRHGIYAIPAFVLGGRLLLLGAQPEAVFEQALAELEASG